MIKKKIIIIFCLVVMTVTGIMFVPMSHRVFALETDLPQPIVPLPLIKDLSLRINNLNFSFPYYNTTVRIHMGSADIECCSEYMGENATRTQIDIASRDFVMDGPVNLKYASLKLSLTIIIYHTHNSTYLYAEGSTLMPAWQYLWTFLSNLT